jgi:hypothetical protein
MRSRAFLIIVGFLVLASGCSGGQGSGLVGEWAMTSFPGIVAGGATLELTDVPAGGSGAYLYRWTGTCNAHEGVYILEDARITFAEDVESLEGCEGVVARTDLRLRVFLSDVVSWRSSRGFLFLVTEDSGTARFDRQS